MFVDDNNVRPLHGFCAPLWINQRNVSKLQYGIRSLSDCERDDGGLLPLAPSAFANSTSALGKACRWQCLSCARCRYISYSSTARTCAWYAHCDENDLRQIWSPQVVKATWRTERVRQFVPSALPWTASSLDSENARPYRIAIATLSLLGGNRHGFQLKQGCGLLGWCQGARRLKRALAAESPHWGIELLVLFGPMSAKWNAKLPPPDMTDCPEAQLLHADRRLKSLISGCLMVGRKRKGGRGEWKHRPFFTGMPSGIMFKWQVMALVQYDAVFLADLDVDVMPIENDPRKVAARWKAALPIFTSKQPQVDGTSGGPGLHAVANSDHASPINTGSMLLRPSGFLYRSGLRALQRCELNKTHGWGLLGTPRWLIDGTPSSLVTDPLLHTHGRIMRNASYERQGAFWTPRYFSIASGGSTVHVPAQDPQLLADSALSRAEQGRRFYSQRWHSRPYFQPLRRTAAYQRDDFGFVAGGEDQGFFWYLLYLHHDVGVLSHPDEFAHRINHYWGTVAGSKAWEGRRWAPNHGESPRLAMNQHYLTRIEPSATGQYSPCRVELMALRKSAETHPAAGRSQYSPPTLPVW